ncbi:PepSY domain-containing protein, partial [Paenibacillus darwinianus]
QGQSDGDGETADDQGQPDGDGEQSDAAEAAALQKLAKLTQEQAVAAASAEVTGTVNQVELEDEDGAAVYSVQIKEKNANDVEVKVSAIDGKIVKVENDDFQQDSEQDEYSQPENFKQSAANNG